MKRKLTLKEIFQGSSSALGIKEVCCAAGLKKVAAIRIRHSDKIPFAVSKKSTPFIGLISPQALSKLNAADKGEACLLPRELIFLFITNSSKIPLSLKKHLQKYQISAAASVFDKEYLKSRLISVFREKLDLKVFFHGVVFEMAGKGVLLIGASGIGKTSAVLAFVLGNHGCKPQSKLRSIISMLMQDNSTNKLQCTSFLKFGSPLPSAASRFWRDSTYQYPSRSPVHTEFEFHNNCWVADDYVLVSKNKKGELIARSHKKIRNLVHTRETGIVSVRKILDPDLILEKTRLRAVIEVKKEEVSDWQINKNKKHILGCPLPWINITIPKGRYFDKNLLKKCVEQLSEDG